MPGFNGSDYSTPSGLLCKAYQTAFYLSTLCIAVFTEAFPGDPSAFVGSKPACRVGESLTLPVRVPGLSVTSEVSKFAC